MHRSLRKWDQQQCQILCRSHHWGHRYTGVKYNTFVRFYGIFSFPSLPFPFLSFFILVVAYSLDARTDFDGWRLKMRVLVQGRAFYMFEPSPTSFWGWYPLKTTPKEPLMLKSQPNTQTRITSKRFKIDKKSQCNMNRKSESPFWNLLS